MTCRCWRCRGLAHDDGTTHLSSGWAYTTADPLTVEDDGPWPNEQLERSRDVVLVCVAGMVIIAILAWLLGRAAA